MKSSHDNIGTVCYDCNEKGGIFMSRICAILLFCFVLTGCTGGPDNTTAPGQPPAAQTSPVETTVPDASEAIPTETDAAAFTSHTEIESTITTWPFNAEPTPETKPAETIRFIVYTPNSTADGFYVNAVEGNIVEGSEYRLTLHEAMVEMCLLTKDVQINSIIQDGTHLTIDFNHAFKDMVCTMGTTGERLLIGSVVNTMIANYDVETVSITVDGGIWESGHVVYDFPMGFFE